MKITLIFNEQISSIDANPDLDVDTLKMIVQAELGVDDFSLIFNNTPLLQGTVSSNAINDNDIIIVHQTQPKLTNPQMLQQFQQLLQQQQQQQEPQPQRDPIQENFEYTMEHHPESFSQVSMLFISCQVNKLPIKCFIDSGAQATIISLDLAKKCELDHLVDKRFGGEAKGVGTGKILGRIHAADLRIGDLFLTCTFLVMETLGVDLIFGLDMLRRHQVLLDLNKNVLKIQNKEFPFLSEHEMPKGMFNPTTPVPLKRQEEKTDLTIGGQSIGKKPQINSQFKEEDVKQLLDLGAKNRHHALELLNKAQGNVDAAASLLFQ